MRAAGKRMQAPVLNWFDFNSEAPSFAEFGDAQQALMRAAAATYDAMNPAKREYAAVSAARLALPCLAALAKCEANDTKALRHIADALEPLERVLEAMAVKDRNGRPLKEENIRLQAKIVLTAYWLTELRPRPIPSRDADAMVAKLIPKALIEYSKREPNKVQLTPIKQLDRWRKEFRRTGVEVRLPGRNKGKRPRASIAIRRNLFEQVHREMMADFEARQRDPKSYSADQVVTWLRGELRRQT